MAILQAFFEANTTFLLHFKLSRFVSPSQSEERAKNYIKTGTKVTYCRNNILTLCCCCCCLMKHHKKGEFSF